MRSEVPHRLLDNWAPPEWAGSPIGCLTTTYTFDAALFEEECLARFLALDSDPQEDGPLFLIEREEKLSSLQCAAVIADSRHARGRRSLRWDVLAARVPGERAQHAKVSLLVWERLVRVLVTSANLTEPGYLKNQEVCGVLDLPANGKGPIEAVKNALDFLSEIVACTAADSPGASARRCSDLIQTAWGQLALSEPTSSPGTHVHFVASGPGRPSIPEQLSDLWPDRTPAEFAEVVSPFFDLGTNNQPTRALWQLLKSRGQAEIHFHTSGEKRPATQGYILHAPEALRHATPERTRCAAYFHRIEQADRPTENGPMYRPFHAKSILLGKQHHLLLCVGSSNFTSAGLGLNGKANFEANLCYLADSRRDSDFYDATEAAVLRGERLNGSDITLWQPSETGEDEESKPPPTLPVGFETAEYLIREGQPCLQLRFGDNLPNGWCLYFDDSESPLLDERSWVSEGRPACVEIPWNQTLPPAGLDVSWPSTVVPAWWPVNVRDGTALPPVEELRDLSLDVLIEILTSARPLHQVMRHILRRRAVIAENEQNKDPALDPHQRVDTSAFILQRTRRVSWAMSGLCERLSRPVATENALDWRLRGPVGVDALTIALAREAIDANEKAFLLAELALELIRIEPRTATGSLPAKDVREQLHDYVETGLTPWLKEGVDSASTGVADYIHDVLNAVNEAKAT